MAKILCVLYDDPVDGYPPNYPRDDVPEIERYPDGQTTPTPEGARLHARVSCSAASRASSDCASSSRTPGHELIVTSDKDGPDSEFERQLAGGRGRHLAAVLARLPDRRADRQGAEPEARDHRRHRLRPRRPRRRDRERITVAEVTYCNSISVSEHVVMMILALVRNYIPSYQQVIDGGWNIADCAARSYDLEGMQVGTVAAGRIGAAVLRRLKPFEVGLHYTDRHRLPEEVE